MPDPDVCVFCAATGCLNGSAEHGQECPFTTGMWPVTEEDIRREACCAACEQPFAIGDLTAQVTDMANPAVGGALDLMAQMGAEPSEVTFTVCLGCAAMGRELAP
jgi:hypothetical protein